MKTDESGHAARATAPVAAREAESAQPQLSQPDSPVTDASQTDAQIAAA
jgi:hypothetical protein